jgi:hypothetical protein
MTHKKTVAIGAIRTNDWDRRVCPGRMKKSKTEGYARCWAAELAAFVFVERVVKFE